MLLLFISSTIFKEENDNAVKRAKYIRFIKSVLHKIINEGNPVVFAKEWHSRNTGPGASTVLDTGVEVKKKDDRGWKIWGEG